MMLLESGPNWVYFYAAGADTGSFLARLASYAVDALDDGHGSRAFILSARGKIQVGFECYRLDSDAFIVSCHTTQAETLIGLLDMYHFGEDFDLQPVDLEKAYFVIGAADHPSLAPLDIGEMTDLHYAAKTCRFDARSYRVVKTGRYGLPVYMVLPLFDEPDPILTELKNVGQPDVELRRLEYERVLQGLPSAPNEFAETYTPLDIGALDGITDGKGCYPGQEVIERTIALGRPSMKLVPVKAKFELKIGQEISHDSRVIGRITSCKSAGADGSIGLAVLKYRSAEQEHWMLAGGALEKRILKTQ
ncbi:MAG: hypothetical protein VYA30_06730 [Myxococcota bacterium]|nr:hypothetical protein [Myxococcota bacterium]